MQKTRCAKRMEIRKAVERKSAEIGGAENQVDNELPMICALMGMDEVNTALGFLLQGSEQVDDDPETAFSEDVPEEETVCEAVS